jgi:dTDP-4-dehydrorhamnose 3,5-epimerase
MIKDVIITHLDVIDAPNGSVLHVMKESSAGYSGFGEAYFSQVGKGIVKAWKRHKEMTLNLVVPVGMIKFVLFDDRERANIQLQEVIISRDNYCRLTVPPMIWVGFQGLSENGSMLLNLANLEHNPDEINKRSIDQIKFNWSN